MYKYLFSAPLELQGLHLADIDCSANISIDELGDWHIESWSVHGIKSEFWTAAAGYKRVEGEIEINRVGMEKDPLKEVLRSAITEEWSRNRIAHESSVAEMLAEDDESPAAIPQIEHDRAIYHQSVL